jgi:hypothetical protein
VTVAEYIAELREAGMTYKHLGRAVGAPEATVYGWGQGITPSTPEVARRLGNLYAHLVGWDVAAMRSDAA